MRSTISLLRTSGLQFGPGPAAAVFCLLMVFCATHAIAQPAVNAQPNAAIIPGGQQNGVLFGGPNAGNAPGQQGAGANADFDSLIDLIQSTVATETWAENGGGEAEMRPFPGGVLVDAAGTLHLRTRIDQSNDLVAKRGASPGEVAFSGLSLSKSATGRVRATSALRFISLPRLEREITHRQADHKPLDPAMLTLAGLQRVRYVFVYPESGDVVLAGPAGDWKVSGEGRIVATTTGEPVVRLDDLLTLFRRANEAPDSHFGCSINPRQEALAKTQAFLASASQRPVPPGERKKWLGELRDTVGRQDIEIFGIEPASRVASVLVEADYHMKLIGMGLAESVDGVESYLDTVAQRAGASPPPAMSVLRWWFTLHYEAIDSSPAGDAFELVGQGVRVLSENELLAAQGQRVHTGQSDPLNRQFAESFTTHFAELAAKYPVYGELRSIFDLAMAVALIRSEGLADRADWQPGVLASNKKLRLPGWPVPREVETVINHRVINRRHIVAGVSGGVIVEPNVVLREVRATNKSLTTNMIAAPPDTSAWWWDAN